MNYHKITKLLARVNFMPKMHLDLRVVLVEHLLKTKKEYKNLKACFQHDMAYG